MEIDKFISNIVETQFPDFYQAEGSNFIAFVRAYYEWMEQEGYVTNASKNLLDYSDIDKTLDEFVTSFKNKYLVDFPSITAADRRFMIKNIKDFYQSKGSTRGIQLLFRLLFDDDIDVYVPGRDILKPSDGIWKIPNYIEVEHNIRSSTFVGKKIYGSISEAEAFVESVYTKVINNRLIDIITISGLRGNFIYDEVVTDNGNFFNAPKVIGSLTSILITDGGANNRVGDVYDVYTSTNGKGGKARVTAVEDGTGRVIFTLVDGGSGYSNALGQVHVSEKVFTTSNRTPNSHYFIYETVKQPLTTVSFSIAPSGSYTNVGALYHTNMYGWSGATTVATGRVVAIPSAANTFIINVLTGNFSLASDIKTESNAITFSGYSLTNSTASGIVTGSNSTAVGLHDITNTFYGNGAFIVANTGIASSNIVANTVTVSSGAGAGFDIGSLSDTEVLFLFTDFIGGNNVGAIPYLNMIISGSNSNTGLLTGTASITTSTATNAVTGVGGTVFTTQLIVGSGLYTSSNVFIGTVNSITNDTNLVLANNALLSQTTATYKYNVGQYGFPKDPGIGYNNYINDALSSNVFTIGTIASLKAVNPGSNYNITPFVLVRNDFIAGYNRKNIILELNNKTGSFAIGDSLQQSFTVPTLTIGYNANSGLFTSGEGITQSNGIANSFATINSISTATSTMVLTNIIGNIIANSAGGLQIRGLSSNVTANVTISTPVNITGISRGHIVSIPDQNTLEIKRDSFNESFVVGSSIISSSGGTANIVAAYQNVNSLAMGNNAIVTANVSTAKGIATRLEVINSGYGHLPEDTIELTNANNIYAITGTANVIYQGRGEGYWENTQGMLNSDKYIIDGEYYQSFSYEVQSRLSLNKYSDILKQLAHVVGTKMFGKVLINSRTIQPLRPETINYREAQILSRFNELLLDRDEDNILVINRNYTVSGYSGVLVVDRLENSIVDYLDQATLLREE